MGDNPDDLPYMAEYAKSGRSKCKGCEADIPKAGADFIEPKEKKGKITDGTLLKDYRTDYALSGAAKCRICEDKIAKGEVRICKKNYIERAKLYGPPVRWYHLKCFAENREQLQFFCSGSKLAGLDTLSQEDQDKVTSQLPKVKRKDEDDGLDEPVNKKARSKLPVIKQVIADKEGTAAAEDRSDDAEGEGDSSSNYVTRIREVSQEIARDEFCKRKNEYEKLLNKKETAEIHLRRSTKEAAVDTSKYQKLEDDILRWNKKGEVLDEEIRELDEKLQGLKNRKQELIYEKSLFHRIVAEKSEKSRSLKHVMDLRKDEIENLCQNVAEIKNQMEEVLKTKKSIDPFTAHLDQQIAQKSRELECPVCLTVCQPPILRCPLDHLVCKMCRPELSVCGECMQQYKGEDRHRYAEKNFEDLQCLIKTREEHARNK